MKKQTLSVLLSGLLTVSLTGVGFASWYIVQGDSQNTGGNIVVENVQEANLTIGSVALSAPDFKFGSNHADTTYNWLQSDDDDAEVLTTTLTFTVANWSRVGSLTVYFEVIDAKDSSTATYTYEDALDGYIVAPTNTSLTKTTLTPTSLEDDLASFSVTYTFAWGTVFGTKNPFEYYNGMKSTDKIGEGDDAPTAAEHADDNLDILYQALTSVTYKITITTAA